MCDRQWQVKHDRLSERDGPDELTALQRCNGPQRMVTHIRALIQPDELSQAERYSDISGALISAAPERQFDLGVGHVQVITG